MPPKVAIIRNAGRALGRTVRTMMDHRNPRDAASISYFSILALFPGVLVLIAVANDLLGRLEFGQRNLFDRMIALFPVSEKFLHENLSQILDPSTTLVLSCVAIVMWTSSWVFSIMENALNRAWDVPKRRTFWQSRIRSITVVVLGGTILLAAVALLAIASPGNGEDQKKLLIYFQDPIITWLWKSVMYCAVLLLAILVFTCVYKLMPDKKVEWKEALSGAAVSALFWECGTFIFIKLVPYFDFERVYGRMGAVMMLLVWVYVSNLFMLFGAHFSAQLHKAGSEQASAKHGQSTYAGPQEDAAGRLRFIGRSR